MKTIKTIAHETWHVRPQYSMENVYRIWDENNNYHDDTEVDTMNRRASLIAAAPKLLAEAVENDTVFSLIAQAMNSITDNAPHWSVAQMQEFAQDWRVEIERNQKRNQEAITKAKEKQCES